MCYNGLYRFFSLWFILIKKMCATIRTFLLLAPIYFFLYLVTAVTTPTPAIAMPVKALATVATPV